MQKTEHFHLFRRTLSAIHVTARPSTPTLAASPELRPALRLAAAFALAKVLLHFALTLYTAHIGYSYFRDEFYFLMCGRHLAWGYVDQGPTVALMARLGEILFGDSVFAIRILPAVAGAIAVGLTGILTWALGGHRAAQALAMLTLLLTPVYIGLSGTLCIPCLEPMFWIGTALCLVLLQKGGSPRNLWLSIGALGGLGLLTKPSMLFFLLALFAALLLTPQRRLLNSPWLVAATLLTLLIIAPFLLWEAHHHWPTWEFLRNGQIHHKTVVLGPVAFLLAQVTQLNPFAALLWVPGIVACFTLPALKPYRWIGLTYLLFLALMFVLHAKDYYLAPIYPILFAAGAIFWEHRRARRNAAAIHFLFGFPVLESVLILTGLLILPMASPVLRPETWARYTHALHLVPNEQETEKASILPQFFADRFGWDQLTDIVTSYTRALSPEARQHLCIFANNYGEAGSLEFLGRRADPDLPTVISGHNNYWLWGMRGCDGRNLIAVVHDKPEDLAQRWNSIQILGTMDNPLAMSFEHRNVYLLQQPKLDHPLDWTDEKDFF
jgi:4-amino-4-deoxy-L-arabinose transferase-like glycosyltransferase